MNQTKQTLIFSDESDPVLKKLRAFFDGKGFKEVHVQNRLSILAACEDPETIITYELNGVKFPHPQTGQMWLEHDLLRNPELKGIYALNTSFRNEPNPVEGRHDLIFPMFEFEMKGGMKDMLLLFRDLFEFLGFGEKNSFPEVDYESVAKKYGVKELDHEHELRLKSDFGDVVFLKDFPFHTAPFWNMKKRANSDKAFKVDVILNGVETIGSAERSCDPVEMREWFNTIADGKYAGKLYSEFGKERVDAELNEFLSHKFFERCGGGMGLLDILVIIYVIHLLI